MKTNILSSKQRAKQDPTEHINVRDAMPDVWKSMLSKLLAHGKTVYQTDYAEPGTDACLTGAQAASYYVGHNTCPPNSPSYNPSGDKCDSTILRPYLGPMCFHNLPPVPPTPPAPPPAPALPMVSIAPAAGSGCLLTKGATFDPIVLGKCDPVGTKHWTTDPHTNGWVAYVDTPCLFCTCMRT